MYMYQFKKKSHDDLKFKAEKFWGRMGEDALKAVNQTSTREGCRGKKQCAQGRGSFH